MSNKKILVLGATGVAGTAFVEHGLEAIHQDGLDWELLGVSRHAGSQFKAPSDDIAWPSDRLKYLSADLLGDHSQLHELSDVTHVVFAGFVPGGTFAEQVAPNRDLLVNCLQALENNPLERVILIQGMKYYGSHLGQFKTPAREDDPRHEGENYYYAQQDALEKSGLAWTCLRPHVICGTSSIGTPQNILTVIGVYAALMKKAGRALSWPGSKLWYQSINQATDANLLAQAIHWALDEPKAERQAYNITNGDFFRWEQLWPRIAEQFEMEVGEVATTNLEQEMPTFESDWQSLVVQHQLMDYPMNKIANWSFANYILGTDWDVMASTIKSRQHGFAPCLDTEQMYLDHLQGLQALRILPA